MNSKGDPKKDKDDLLRECRELADADAADALKSGHSSEHEYFIALSGRITAALSEPQGVVVPVDLINKAIVALANAAVVLTVAERTLSAQDCKEAAALLAAAKE